MEDNTILGIIQQTLAILEKEVGLAKSTLDVVASRSFKPISEFFKEKQEVYYSADLLNELDQCYQENLKTGVISRNVYNLRTRGTRILREVYETDNFVWKGPVSKSIPVLPESFEHIINGLADTVHMEVRSRDTLYIVRRFLLLLANFDINNISQIESEHVQMFLSDISQSRAKSMDDVVGALRKLNRYLTGLGLSGLPYSGLLMAPRARERKIYP